MVPWKTIGRTAPLAFAFLLVACEHKTDGPTPSITAPLIPQLACNDQVAQVVVVNGKAFSPLNDHTLLDTARLELPQVTLQRTQDIAGMSVDPSGTNTIGVPNDPDHPELSDEAWASQEQMSFGICPKGTCTDKMLGPPLLSDWPTDAWSDGKIPTGLYSVVIKNRAQPQDTTLANALVVVPIPDLQRVDADLACKDKDNTFTLTGDFFLLVNGVKPELRFYDDQGFDKTLPPEQLDLPADKCRALPAPAGLDLKACTVINATVKVGFVTFKNATDTFRNLRLEVRNPPPVPSASMQNPNIGCHSTTDVEITFVPEPQLAKILPDIICDAENDRMIQLQGFAFLTVDGHTPAVNLDAMTMLLADSATDCSDVGRMGYPREKVQSCKTLTLTIPKSKLPPTMAGDDPANYNVTVTNPPPADCTTHPPIDLTVTAPPLVTTIVPDLMCNAQGDSSFTLTGKGFLQIGTATASVTFVDAGGKMVTVDGTYDQMSCRPAMGPTEVLQVCTVLHVTVPKGSLAVGTATVTVKNPDPSSCSSSPPVSVLIVPPPTLLSAKPAQVCTAQGDVPIILTGTDFLVINQVGPTATFTPETMGMTLKTAPGMASGCTSIDGLSEPVQKCTQVTVVLPKNSVLVDTIYDVSVTNPDPAGCTSVNAPPITIKGTPPPTISSVSPMVLCTGGGTLTINGTNLEAGATVSVGPLLNQAAAVKNSMVGTVNVGFGLPPGGPYDVTWNNPDGCSAVKPAAVSVKTGLIVFFADPPTVWNGIATQITVYGANVDGTIQSISIVPTGSNAQPLALQVSNAKGNRATALVPGPVNGVPTVAAGVYDVIVNDASCPAVLTAGLKVVDKKTFNITKITPNYGSTQTATSVTITSMGAFVATPRAYLSSGANAATPLSAVSFVDANTLTGVVPAGTPLGVYDLIVVNPDGGVGVLQGAFTVIQNLPPIVTALQPAVVNTQQNQVFQVVGKNFANDAKVTFSCYDATNTALPGTPTAISQAAPATCAFDASQQCISVTATYSSTIAYCVVTVTNVADKASFDFSALVINNPALKLSNFTPTQSGMTTARRAFGLATVNATPSARFIYAVGGDGGTQAGALNSVEASTVDIYGKMGKWSALPNHLSSKRTFVGLVAVDRWLYAVGGSDGVNTLDSVERAYVLNPADVAHFTDLNLDLPPQGSKGVPGGIFYYQVAPVMLGGDAFNPGGENLPSDPLVIQAPDLANGAYITLSWAAVPGAAYYRVYRSPTPNLGSGSEVLIADNVAAGANPTYQDKYASPVMPIVNPLPLGATGLWSSLAGYNMKSKRMGAAVVTVANLNNPDSRYIYVLGGNSNSEAMPATLATTEIINVTINPNGSQDAAPGLNSPTLAAARWQHGGYAAVLANTAYLWTFGGYSAVATFVNTGEISTVGNGGLPGAWVGMTKVPGPRAGYAAWEANNFLYVFGGLDNGVLSAGGVQGDLSQAPPQPFNWPNATGAFNTARYLMGATQQSGFFFVCGGVTMVGNPPTVSNTCETTIY